MDRISEIDRRRALRKLNELALRRERENAVLIHRHAGMFEQLLRARRMFEDLDEVADPGMIGRNLGRALLVGPVGREPVFRLSVHLAGADLDFDPHLLVMDDRGMERSVAVALRRRDEVLEAARDHRPALVNEAERAIAFLDRADDAAKRHDVGQLLEAYMALGHLAPDRIGVLLAPRDLGFDAIGLEMRLEAATDALDEIAAAFLVELGKPARDRFIGGRLDLAKRQRLHLGHELVHADPLGERRIDIHRLARDPPPLLLILDEMERAHIVQSVGELDEQHADIVRHCEQELAEVLGGALALALRLDLGQLGDAIDEARNIGPEMLLDLLGRRKRILDRVVEDRGGDRLVVKTKIGEDAGHLDRMAEIGIARGAGLRPVRLHREDIGAVDQRLVGVRVVALDLLDQFILPEHRSRMW